MSAPDTPVPISLPEAAPFPLLQIPDILPPISLPEAAPLPLPPILDSLPPLPPPVSSPKDVSRSVPKSSEPPFAEPGVLYAGCSSDKLPAEIHFHAGWRVHVIRFKLWCVTEKFKDRANALLFHGKALDTISKVEDPKLSKGGAQNMCKSLRCPTYGSKLQLCLRIVQG